MSIFRWSFRRNRHCCVKSSRSVTAAPSPGEWLHRDLQWRRETFPGGSRGFSRAELLVPSGARMFLVAAWSQRRAGCPGGSPEPTEQGQGAVGSAQVCWLGAVTRTDPAVLCLFPFPSSLYSSDLAVYFLKHCLMSCISPAFPVLGNQDTAKQTACV